MEMNEIITEILVMAIMVILFAKLCYVEGRNAERRKWEKTKDIKKEEK